MGKYIYMYTKGRTMKNWENSGFPTILILGFLLISGCSNLALSAAEPNAVNTPNPEIEHVTTLVTPIPIAAAATASYSEVGSGSPSSVSSGAQDPIIGVWRILSSNGSYTQEWRIGFKSDNTYESSFFYWDKGTFPNSGKWIKLDSNSYLLDPQTSNPEAIIYDSERNGIYPAKYPTIFLTPYQGNVKVGSSSSASTPAPTSLYLQTTVPVSQYSRNYNVKRAIAGKWKFNPDKSYSAIVYGEVFGTSSDVLLSVYPGSESKGCPDFNAGEGAYSEMKFSDRIPVTPDKPGYGVYKYVLSFDRWDDGFYYMILTINSGEQICMSFEIPHSPPNMVITGAGSPGAINIFSEWIAKGDL
jgi:hypothetical protein